MCFMSQIEKSSQDWSSHLAQEPNPTARINAGVCASAKKSLSKCVSLFCNLDFGFNLEFFYSHYAVLMLWFV